MLLMVSHVGVSKEVLCDKSLLNRHIKFVTQF